MRKLVRGVALLATLSAISALAQTGQTTAVSPLSDDGVFHVRDASIPPSPMMSDAARRAMLESRPTEGPGSAPPPETSDMAELRRLMNARLQPNVARMIAAFPVDIQETHIDGISVAIVTPRGGVPPENRNRVLVNAPGGGFRTGIRANGLMVSIPVAALGRFRVITILYRQGPEHLFPAATEDLLRVYRTLLRNYPAANIGLFGCSAGGALVAQTIAHLRRDGVPGPGVAGIYCAGAGAQFSGDSAAFAAMTMPSPPPAGTPLPGSAVPDYFRGMDISRPDISPVNSLEILAGFPPTILVTGTRDFAMSAAAYSHRRLREAGVESDLLIYDGLGHGFMTNAALPETRNAQQIAVRFYDHHLGREER